MKRFTVIVFFVIGIVMSILAQTTTYTALSGSFSSSTAPNYLIKPTGASKVELTITITSNSIPPATGAGLIFYDGDNTSANVLNSLPSMAIGTYTITNNFGNSILIVNMNGSALTPFTATYKTITNTWLTSGSNVVFNNGNVGIGTLTPDFPLTVESSSVITHAKIGKNLPLYLIANNPNIGFNAYSEGGNWKYGSSTSASYGASMGLNPANGKLGFYFSQTAGNQGNVFTSLERFSILPNGFIGIGNNNPASRLSIQQASGANTEGINLKNGSTNWYMYTNSANNLTLSQGTVGNGLTINNTSGAMLMSLGDYWTTGQTSLVFKTSAAANGFASIQAIKAKTTTTGGDLYINPEGGKVGVAYNTNFTLQASLNVRGDNTLLLEPTGGWTDGNSCKIMFGVTNEAYIKKEFSYAMTFYDTENFHFLGGNVIIGKTNQINSAYKLDVEGTIRAKEIKVNTDGADFVFAPNYKLRTLAELEAFIKQNQHLPEIAPATDMQTNGVNVSELQTKLLQKVEELTLYLIELKKENAQMKKEIEELKKK